MHVMARPQVGPSYNFPLPPTSVRPRPETVERRLLLEECVKGNPRAWDRLIQLYHAPVLRFAYSLCGNHADAEDISLQVFGHLFRNLHTFRNDAAFSTWLFKIVRNTFQDVCVRPSYRAHFSLDAPNPNGDGILGHDIEDPLPTPESVCLAQESARLLVKAIHYLPEYQREVVKMYHFEGKSYEEIALATGMSVGTIKSRLNRARTMLRDRLAPIM